MSLIQDHSPACNSFPTHEQALRAALAWVRGRYDDGAISPAVFSVIRMIETEIAWLAHRGEEARS
jgi:hypothetical protein